jgi:hypothetical protein
VRARARVVTGTKENRKQTKNWSTKGYIFAGANVILIFKIMVKRNNILVVEILKNLLSDAIALLRLFVKRK